MRRNGFAGLADVAGLATFFYLRGPDSDQEKFGWATNPNGGEPFSGGSADAKDFPGGLDDDAEAFSGICAEPAGLRCGIRDGFDFVLRAFRDYGDVRSERLEQGQLAAEGHFAIPGDDSHCE